MKISAIGATTQPVFKGYTKTQELMVGTSGTIDMSYNDCVDKNPYADLKTVYNITTYGQEKDSSGKLKFKVYMADVNETVDRSKLASGINYLVEYQRPEPKKFSDVNDFFATLQKSEGKFFDKQVQYTNAWKDLFQQQYDKAAETQKSNLEDNDRLAVKLTDEDMKNLSDKMYFLWKDIEAYTQLNRAMQQVDKFSALKNEHRYLSSALENFGESKTRTVFELNKTTAEKEESEKTLKGNLDKANDAYNKASAKDKGESESELVLAESTLKQAQPKLKKLEDKIANLEKELKRINDMITRYSKEKSDLENNPDFQIADQKRQECLEQIRKIYAEHFPEYLDQ